MIGIGDKMKKIMSDKSFWLILCASILTLIAFTIGVIFLTGRNTKEFYSAGYIISSNTTKSDKYYFEEKTVYKENVFEEYVFKDVDNKEVSTKKDNFIHYLDNSLSFMKNGVILDLDNFNENIVPYYNITDKSIIRYNNGGYYIETTDKTLVFGNFLGRITDNKYIVVGNDISVKLSGNDESVRGDYFEILFVENGIVKVENQEGSYQTLSEGTIVYIGDDIKINLGDKSVIYGDETKLSLSELTIDGNENIDIVPENLVDKTDKENDKNGDDYNSVQESGNGLEIQKPTDNSVNNGTGNETTTILKKEVAVNLIEASSDVNSISTKFQVIDTAGVIKGNLILTLVNITTGETVYSKLLVNTPEEQSVIINSLASNCNYVMTIVDENNKESIQYFQKSFKTESLNLRLKREMVTETSLSYSLDFGVNSDVVSANISLYDEKNNELGRYIVSNGSDDIIIFEGLTHNTLYNVVVDNVVIKNVQYDKLYNTKTSDLTLKNKPVLGGVSVKTDDDSKTFTLSMDSLTDEDKAIVKYTYKIFRDEDLTEETMTTAVPVYSFVRSNLDDEILKLDEAKELYGNTNYKFKIVCQYYDNYRYNEIETMLSNSFDIVGKPTITFEEDIIDFNRISGTVVIDDTDCTIPFEGRECNNAPNDFVIRYYTGSTGTRTIVENVVVDNEKQTLYFDLNGLQENTLYTFEVFSDIDLKDDNGIQEDQYIGGFNVSTTGISALMMQNWGKNGYSYKNPISVNTEMVSTTPDDDSIDKLASIKFNLYSGDVSKVIDYSTPIASIVVNENIKEQFYNKLFSINSTMFEFEKDITGEDGTVTKEMVKIENLDVLKELSGGRLNRNYTIEVTDAKDETGTNEFAIMNNIYVYDTPAILLLEDEVSEPEIIVEEIKNINTKATSQNEKGPYEENYGIKYSSKLSDNIVRGYKVTAVFDKAKIENFAGYGSIESINFYATNISGSLIERKNIDFTNEENYTIYFFLGDGTDYNVVDKDLRRGNKYNFSYDISIDDDSNPDTDSLSFPSNKPISDYFLPVKQLPLIKLYIDNSTNNSIVYKYKITDYDNALYKAEEDVNDKNKYYLYYTYDGLKDDYKVEVTKDDSSDTFTLTGLSNGSIYDVNYYGAVNKHVQPSKIQIGKYYFDGYYNAEDYNLGYELEYGNFDNRLKIILDNNEFLDRISAYLVTLEVGDEKYQTVVTDLSKCNENNISNDETNSNNCIIIDYKDIASFKGKDIKVTLDAFYDTGYVGFSQPTRLGNYFKSIGIVDNKNASKVGYVYQTTGIDSRGEYFYITRNINNVTNQYVYSYSSLSSTPKGIMGFELLSTDKFNDLWKLNTNGLVDMLKNKFIKYGEFTFNNSNVIPYIGSINIVNNNRTINPKVLDKVTIQTTNNTFKFTSIIPKVSTELEPLINGTIMDINLSMDNSTLEKDFVKTDGKYKFYIDIYEQNYCEENSEECTEGLKFIKTVNTDYDEISNEKIIITGLNPDTKYYYKISADMNKNGQAIKTPLFDKNKDGYVVHQEILNTLNKDKIFDHVGYNHTSNISEERYNERKLHFTSYLKNNINFNLKYELFDTITGECVLEHTVDNKDITINGNFYTAKYITDISGNDFVFGPGYYKLVITAVTTDLGKELELYNDVLIYDSTKGMNFNELDVPVFGLTQTAGITQDYKYYINYNITVVDKDKVIDDGKVYIELQNSSYDSACSNVNDCKATADLKNNTCDFANGTCTIAKDSTGKALINIKFSSLKPDTNYVMYVHANTYRNNVSLTKKDGETYIRKSQYTKSELGFSLGAVTPTAKSENKLIITFVGSTNLTDPNVGIVGIDYNVNIQGGDKVTSGSLGKTETNPDGDGKSLFTVIGNSDPTIDIPIPDDKKLGQSNFIILTYYYYNEDGELTKLKIGEDTSYQYTVINER